MLTGEEKAALLLTKLGPQAAEAVLTALGGSPGGRLRATMQRLETKPPTKEAIDQVLEEFANLAELVNNEMERGAADSKASATPPKAAQAYAEAARTQGQETTEIKEQSSDLCAVLEEVGPDRLAAALQSEQPRTICLIFNTMPADQAGEILKRLPPPCRRQVSVALGAAGTVAPVVLQKIVDAVARKARAMEPGGAAASDEDRSRRIAEMLRKLTKADRLEMVAALGEQDPKLAAAVKEHLYQIEDLLFVEDRCLQKILGEVDSKTLAVAVKTASDKLKTKLLGNLSKRARDTLTEEMEFLRNISAAATEQAQKEILAVVQRLDQAGELILLE